jgi:hypothetical protein
LEIQTVAEVSLLQADIPVASLTLNRVSEGKVVEVTIDLGLVNTTKDEVSSGSLFGSTLNKTSAGSVGGRSGSAGDRSGWVSRGSSGSISSGVSRDENTKLGTFDLTNLESSVDETARLGGQVLTTLQIYSKGEVVM